MFANWRWLRNIALLWLSLSVAFAKSAPRSNDLKSPLFGTLQTDPKNAVSDFRAGARLATLGIIWTQFEPAEGAINSAYVKSLQQRISAFRQAGLRVVIDIGLQYPPPWIYALPNSRFVNQYGDAFNQDAQSGYGGMNAVFNQHLRENAAAYVHAIFKSLGADFFAVRAGGGYFGELHYPNPEYRSHRNCFWAFDDIAQGRAPGLPPSVGACPVPGWIPGAFSPDRSAARRFADWYLNAITDYQNWQIAAIRRDYPGTIFMLYPSWGMRPGGFENRVTSNLKDSDNTELNRGNDFAQQIAAIADPHVAVYCTWCDSSPSFGDDASLNPVRWSPVHYLAALARSQTPALAMWAENTGHVNSIREMQLSFQRVRDNGLDGFFWAFEPDLYSSQPQRASIDDFAKCIAATRNR